MDELELDFGSLHEYRGDLDYATYRRHQEEHPGVAWSDWQSFERSSNVAYARYKLDGSGTWQVRFGGKDWRQRKLKDYSPVVSKESLYEYGPDDRLTDARFWEWVNQYAHGGSAGIWLDLNVKRAGVPYQPIG